MTIIEFDFGKTWTLPLFEPLPLAQWLQFGKKTLEKSSTISRIISQSEQLYWNITLWLIITKNNNKNQNEKPFNKTEVCTMLLNISLWSKRLCEKNQSSKQKKKNWGNFNQKSTQINMAPKKNTLPYKNRFLRIFSFSNYGHQTIRVKFSKWAFSCRPNTLHWIHKMQVNRLNFMQ